MSKLKSLALVPLPHKFFPFVLTRKYVFGRSRWQFCAKMPSLGDLKDFGCPLRTLLYARSLLLI